MMEEWPLHHTNLGQTCVTLIIQYTHYTHYSWAKFTALVTSQSSSQPRTVNYVSRVYVSRVYVSRVKCHVFIAVLCFTWDWDWSIKNKMGIALVVTFLTVNQEGKTLDLTFFSDFTIYRFCRRVRTRVRTSPISQFAIFQNGFCLYPVF